MNFDELIKEAFESKKYSTVVNLVEKRLKETQEKLSEEILQYYLKSLSYFGIYDRALKYLRNKTPKNYKLTKDKYNNAQEIYEEISKGNVSESILFDYFIALVKIGEFEKAYSVLNNLRTLYHKYIDEFLLTIILLRCNKFTEAKSIVDNTNFNGNQLFKIGVTFYSIGQYKLSRKTLEEARVEGFSNHYDELYEKIINIINKHNKTGKYISMNFEYFIQNNELQPGDIIYVSDVDEEYKKKDSHALNRTYMIWKIKERNVYAFPVTTKIPEDIRYYKLYKQNYLNFNSDRVVKSDIVKISKGSIQKVQERLTQEDYNNVLSNIYSGIIVLGDEKKYQEKSLFIDEMYNKFQVEKNDVIVAYKREKQSAKNYLVIDQDEKYLYCIELVVARAAAAPASYSIEKIDKRKELLRVNKSIKVNKSYKKEIESVKSKLKKLSK